mmetsp:Transcript_23079/g.58516  ORF Transcript_23079/g.58516 Transcript_23079/m.58516 type:complete len:143 (+) Transcript_23079:1564-1992(+)
MRGSMVASLHLAVCLLHVRESSMGPDKLVAVQRDASFPLCVVSLLHWRRASVKHKAISDIESMCGKVRCTAVLSCADKVKGWSLADGPRLTCLSDITARIVSEISMYLFDVRLLGPLFDPLFLFHMRLCRHVRSLFGLLTSI